MSKQVELWPKYTPYGRGFKIPIPSNQRKACQQAIDKFMMATLPIVYGVKK